MSLQKVQITSTRKYVLWQQIQRLEQGTGKLRIAKAWWSPPEAKKREGVSTQCQREDGPADH